MKNLSEPQLGSTVALLCNQGNIDTDGVFRYWRLFVACPHDIQGYFLFAEKESKESQRTQQNTTNRTQEAKH